MDRVLIVNNRARLATPLACLALLLTWVVSPAVASGRSVRPAAQTFRLRALGDSVTAGFGFLSNGTEMSVLDLPFCVPPGATPNNRCSSNSPNGPGETGPVGWLPDYGLANNVSWAAQSAHMFGLTGTEAFQNLAVSGSTPANWAPGGYLSPVLQQIIADDPNLTVMTLGANPLLSIFLTGRGAFCAFTFSDAELRACVNRFIRAQQVGPLMKEVVSELLTGPSNHVVVSLYHLAIPSVTVFSAHQIGILFATFNAAISDAVGSLPQYGTRVAVMSPPRFFVGLGPGSFICPGSGALVDGPSHQSTATQDELAIDPFGSFCAGNPWIISADTGIHPDRQGYAQFATVLAALVRQHGWGPPPSS
jgi:lysophospholipase L1-like esterase